MNCVGSGGRGVASLLLSEAERFGSSLGLTRAFLSTTPFLHGAIRLYEHAGYTLEGPAPDLFGTPLGRMAKALRSAASGSAASG